MTQTAPIVILSAVLAALVGGGVAVGVGALRESRAVEAGAAGQLPESTAVLERLSGELERLSARPAELGAALERLSADSELVSPASARVSLGDIDAAVARFLDSRGEAVLEGAAEAAEVAPVASTEARVAAAMEAFAADGLSDSDYQALWRKYAKEGLGDELLAAFEAMAEASPNDPDMQVAVAGAYLNKIFEVGNSPEAGLWATKADKAFDRALELDDHHWDARFSKAVSLSFWPPVFGKQGEAIQQFEVLVEQQRALPADARYAQTHLLLGNMYQQIGQDAKAAGAWRSGLELYPGNEELLGQLEAFSGNE